MKNLVKSICQEFPEDKNVRGTMDKLTWYKVIKSTKTLLAPPINILRTSPILLDRFIEALQAFAVMDVNASEYDWDNLNLFDSTDDQETIDTLNMIRNQYGGQIVSCDIETKRVEWEDTLLLSLGVAVSEDTCYAFHNLNITGASGSTHNPKLWQALEDFFADRNLIFLWQGGKFDTCRLKYLCNLDARVDEDTMLQHYAQINEKRGTHGLKEMGQLYLQSPAWDDELDKIKKQWCKVHKISVKEFTYDLIPIRVLIPYMQRDCIAAYRLLFLFRKLARPGSNFIYRKLIEASAVFKDIELAGFQIDLNYLEELEYTLDVEISKTRVLVDAAVKDIWDPMQYSKDTGAKASINTSFNLASPKQFSWMLKQVLGYAVPSTDAEFINSLLKQVEEGIITNPKAVNFLNSLGNLRQQEKYMGTYVQGIRRVVCGDGRVRGTFNLHGTETGRLSSKEPNMQNIPRNKLIKNEFVAKPGYTLLQLDYSQAELRVLAYLSQDPFLLKAYQNDEDLHGSVAEDLFGPDYNKEQRNMAKTINFGIAFGRGPSSISENFNRSMTEAKDIIEKWFASKPKVKEYIKIRRAMPIKGEPCLTILGRERHFVITNENLYHVQNEYINTPIQSVASDMTLFSLMNIHKYLKSNGFDAKIISSVHDSIILEVLDNKELIDTIARRCKEIMAETPQEYIPNCNVPFKADADIGVKWGELEEWDA